MAVSIGQKAPDFCMETTKNLDTLEHKAKLSDYLGKWLVLFFYPLDFTFVCPTEIRGFNTRLGEFNELNTEVLGVSTDSVFLPPGLDPDAGFRRRAGRINVSAGFRYHETGIA